MAVELDLLGLAQLLVVADGRRPEDELAREAHPDGAVVLYGLERRDEAADVALDVDDRSGVLAAVATAFADQGVSIQTVRQEGRGADAQLVVVSHAATDAALSATVDHLRTMDIVRDVTSVMRVEGGDE